jgi:hypothetical protein
VVQSERAGVGVHLVNEPGFAADDLRGGDPGDVVAGRDQEPLEYLAPGQLLASRMGEKQDQHDAEQHAPATRAEHGRSAPRSLLLLLLAGCRPRPQ